MSDKTAPLPQSTITSVVLCSHELINHFKKKEIKKLTEIEVGRGAVIRQRRWRCEGMGGALVGQGHAHWSRGRTEAQGAVVETSMSDGGEAGGGAFV